MAGDPDGVKWTREQRAGIETTGAGVLLSAAAGSGKTAVLAERCAYLVCDAQPACDVDELLVVTFTKAAAAEMRLRIGMALRQRAGAAGDDRRLRAQLRLLDRAHIGTLHAFCTTVLRQHYQAAGVDPAFRVLDEDEVSLLRREIARDVIDERYETDSDGRFQRFVDLYAAGDDEIVLNRVIGFDQLLQSLLDPRDWIKKARERLQQAVASPRLFDSELGRELAAEMRERLDDVRSRLIELLARIDEIEGLDAYFDYTSDLLATLETWRDALAEGDFDALASQCCEFKAARLPTIRNAPPEKTVIQAEIDALKKEMCGRSIRDRARFTEAQWRDGISATLEPMEELFALAEAFARRFADAKRALSGVDFNDLERLTLRVLRDGDGPSAVARGYHMRFAHVLVDEYQDINHLQDEIIRLVSRESVATRDLASNLFCVGDVKQSIYRFRLAEPRRFLDRYRAASEPRDGALAPAACKIDLSTNFRSRGPLLNVINAIFEAIMTASAGEIDYDDAHRLRAGATFPAPSTPETRAFHGAPVELHLLLAGSDSGARTNEDEDSDASVSGGDDYSELNRTEREAALIVKRVRELVGAADPTQRHSVADRGADGAPIYRPIRYRDIVILLRSLKHKADVFADALRAAAIPVFSGGGAGFFQTTEVRDLVALLKVLDNQQQDIPLAAVLRSPLMRLSDADDSLARIRLAFGRDGGELIPFHRAVVRYAAELEDQLAGDLRSRLKELSEWRRLANERPVAEVVTEILNRTGYLTFVSGLPDGAQRVSNIHEFQDRVRQFGSFERQGLSRLVAFLDDLAEHADPDRPSVLSEADDVVRIMSVHASKGLEFPVVIIPDLGKLHNFGDASGSILIDRHAGVGLMVADRRLRVRYPSLPHFLVQERIRRQSLAEEMRVLYVAVTRAREHLILIGSCEEKTLESWNRWTSHSGPLPAQRILASRTMLDWIGPVAAMLQGRGAEDRIETILHGDQEIARWTIDARGREELTPEQLDLADLKPLPTPASPATQEIAQRVIDRVIAPYRYEAFTRLQAAQSVGSRTKDRNAPDFDDSDRLKLPTRLQASIKPTAADRGTVTHTMMQHLDFTNAGSREQIAAQLGRLRDRQVLSEGQVKLVEVEAIEWLAGTPLGELLRSHSALVRREVPILYAEVDLETSGLSSDPIDRIMVRGRVDVMIVKDDGIIIADYKTGAPAGADIDARLPQYRAQLGAYRDAVARIMRRPVRSAYLALLTARRLIEL